MIVLLNDAGAVVAATNGSDISDIYDALWELEDLSEYANLPSYNGRLTNNVTIKSPDEKASLVIPKGAIIQDSAGFPLYLVKIHTINIGAIASYDVSPIGATFSSSGNVSRLNIVYDPSKIPEGAAESNLSMKKYEENEWKPVESVFNTTTHTATTKVTKSAIFSVFADKITNNNTTSEASPTPTSAPTSEPAAAPSIQPGLKPAVWGDDVESTDDDEEVEEETPGFGVLITLTAIPISALLIKRRKESG